MLRLVKKGKPKGPEPKPPKAKVQVKQKTKPVMKTVQQAKPKVEEKPKRKRKPKIAAVPAPVPAPVPTCYPSGLPIVSMEERRSARIEAHVRLIANLHLAKVYLRTSQKEIELYKADKRAKKVMTDKFQELHARFDKLEQLHRRKLEKARKMNADQGVKKHEIEVQKQPKHGTGDSGTKKGQKTDHREGGNPVRIEAKPKVRQGEGKRQEGVRRLLKRRG